MKNPFRLTLSNKKDHYKHWSLSMSKFIVSTLLYVGLFILLDALCFLIALIFNFNTLALILYVIIPVGGYVFVAYGLLGMTIYKYYRYLHKKWDKQRVIEFGKKLRGE